MRQDNVSRILLLLLPMSLAGCGTYLTVDYATHAFRHDTIRTIAKAAVTADGELVVLANGSRAESSKVKSFTIIASLSTNEDGIWVPRDGMIEGWEIQYFSRTDAVPVTVAAPVVLPSYESALGHPELFQETAGSNPTLYLIRHSKPDAQTRLLFITNDRDPRKIEIGLDGREVKTPKRYPLLLFVPLTLAVDLAALPFEIYFLSTYGDKVPHVEPVRE